MSKGALIGQGRIAEVFAWGDNQVLKLFRDWCPPDWVDREAQIARTVQATGLPAPVVGEVVEVDDRRGILYQRIEGPSLFEKLNAKPWTLVQAARLLAELHAAIHACDVPQLPPLKRHLEGKIRDAKPLSEAQKQAALAALAQLPDQNKLCHGDFHPDNVIMSPHGPVIIDWPTASRGHPLADVARTSLLMRVGGLPPTPARRLLVQALRSAFQEIYLRRYLQRRPFSQEDLAAWELPVTAGRLSEDIPEERHRVLELVEASLRRQA